MFDRNRAERYLLLARDLPGYNVQLTLKPAGTGPGELIGEVSVIRQPYSLDAMVQNLAGQETGRWGGQLRGPGLWPDRARRSTFVSVYSTLDFKEQQILQVGPQLPPGNEGLTRQRPVHLCLDQAVDRQRPGRSRHQGADPVRHARPGLSADPHPVAQSVARRRLRFRQPEGRFLRAADPRPAARRLPARRFRCDRPEVAAAEMAGRRRDRASPGPRHLRRQRGLTAATPGATRRRAGPMPTPTATLIRFNGSAELALGNSLAVAVSPRAQYGFDPLLQLRGIHRRQLHRRPRLRSGDHHRRQRRRRVGRTARAAAGAVQALASCVQPYLFGDAAWVWNRRSAQNVPAPISTIRASQVGSAAASAPCSTTGCDRRRRCGAARGKPACSTQRRGDPASC